MLTDDDRALGHRLAGEWLEQAGRSDAMALAEHFQRGGEPARAVRWYQRAAEQALGPTISAAAIERAEPGWLRRRRARPRGAAPDPGRGPRLARRARRGRAARARGGGGAARRAAPRGCARRPRRSSRAAKHGRLDVVERRSALVGETPCAPDAGGAQRADDLPGLGATYLIFGGRIAAADALIARIVSAHGAASCADARAAGAGR